MTYPDRCAAGIDLAAHLTAYAGRPDVLVLGLVRGGVPVAAQVARRLGVGLDALIVRKLGVPWAPEVAFGALGPGDVRVFNDEISDRLAPQQIAMVLRHETVELGRRERRYRRGRVALDLRARAAIVVDDGLATGATARAGVEVARKFGAHEVIVAVPVGSVEAVRELAEVADRVVCPLVPDDFGAVSRHYDDFGQVTDVEVVGLLHP